MPELTGEAPPPMRIEPGGALAVVSDGIFEAMDPAGEQFTTKRVIDTLDAKCGCPPPEVISSLTSTATAWTGTDEPVDDQTIVVVRRI